jgi:hypothetical protein
MKATHCLMIAALVAGLIPSTARAQDQSADVRELASLVGSQQARIEELKAELERQSAALAELTRRLEALTPAVTNAQGGTPPLAPEITPEPLLTDFARRFQFYGDTKVRFETLNQSFPGCIGCPDRRRGRLRLRLGVEGNLTPDFKAVMGLGVGELNDPNTVYVNLGSDFSRKVISWDRAYVEYHPAKAKWMDLTAGKFPYTWIRSSMTFDVDFYPEGLSQRFSFDLHNAGVLKNVGVQGFELIANEQPIDQHMTIVGTQLTARTQLSHWLTTGIAATGLNIHNPDLMLHDLLSGNDIGVKNTNQIVMNNGVASYVSGFRYANVIVDNTIRTPWPALPVAAGFEYQHNLRAASNRDTAWSLRFDAGRAQKQGDWDFGWHIFRVEQEATLAGLGESDWRAPTNVLQNRYGVDWMVRNNVQLSFTLYSGRTLDSTLPGALLAPSLPAGRRDPWTNRMYFDVTYRY